MSTAVPHSVRAQSVLFVDDDVNLRSSMQEALVCVGVTRCMTVGSLSELQAHGDEALSTELAILDVNLGPGEPNGLDVYRWLDHAGYEGRVVFLTGHAAGLALVKQAAERAGSSVLEKPIGLAQLKTILSEDMA